jgi:hypothetical protein
MPSAQEILSFYQDWDWDPFEEEALDAEGWKRLSVSSLQQAAPRRSVKRKEEAAVAPKVKPQSRRALYC